MKLTQLNVIKSSSHRLFLIFLALAGCKPYSPTNFDNGQIEPDSACWGLNISDGIDVTNSNEFKGLFDCLNQTGAFVAFEPLITHWTSPSSGLPPLAISISEGLNALGHLDYSLIDALGSTSDLVIAHPELIDQSGSILVELIYATERDYPPDNLSGQSSINNGLMMESLDITHQIGNHLQNNPESIQASLNWQLSSITKDVTCTIMSIDEQYEDVESTIHSDLLEFLEAPLNTNNDQWIGSEDDSLRNWFVSASLDNSNVIYELQPTIHGLISDQRVQNELEDLLIQQQISNNLEKFPSSLYYLLSVDKNGGILNDDEKSAFHHIMEIIEQTNQPLECGFEILDVPITTIEIDNLAVQMLTRLADVENSNISTALDLLYILDLGIAQYTLDRIINSGTCPIINQDLLDNMVALERLNDEPAKPVFELGIDAVRRLKHDDEEQNKLYEIADLITTIHSNSLTEPTEELLRDLLPTNLMNGLIELIPHLVVPPTSSSLCPPGSGPLDFKDILSHSSTFIDPNSRHLYDTTILVEGLLTEETIWKTRDKVTTYLGNENMIVMNPLDYLKLYLQFDSDMELLRTVANLYGDETIRNGLLRLITDPISISLFKRSNAESPGPLALVGKWIYSDTIDDILLLVKWVLVPLHESNNQ